MKIFLFRLMEFGETPSSSLTLEEFMNVDLEEEQDPPSFKMARKKDKERLAKVRNCFLNCCAFPKCLCCLMASYHTTFPMFTLNIPHLRQSFSRLTSFSNVLQRLRNFVSDMDVVHRVNQLPPNNAVWKQKKIF